MTHSHIAPPRPCQECVLTPRVMHASHWRPPPKSSMSLRPFFKGTSAGLQSGSGLMPLVPWSSSDPVADRGGCVNTPAFSPHRWDASET